MKILRFLGICVGLCLVAVLIHEVGWEPIRNTLALLGWKYLIILAYPLTWMMLNTVGWWYACHPDASTIGIMELAQIRLAGETFNSLLPSSYLGGEPVKAKLLSAWVPLGEATSSVLIAKAAQSIGLLFYIGLGLALGLPVSASPALHFKAWMTLALLSVGVTLFSLLLAHQSFSRLGRFLQSVTQSAWLLAQEKRLASLDDSLGRFYRDCKNRFFASVLWQSVGWLTGALELWIIFYLVGHPMTWRQAWFMGAMAQLGAVIGLISPGGLGFYEGGHYVAAVLLGLPPSLGVSVSLIRRVREIFWDLVGLYYFWRYSKSPKGRSA